MSSLSAQHETGACQGDECEQGRGGSVNSNNRYSNLKNGLPQSDM